ncbi:hypothetical protein [Planococcus beijingensis]|uniref:hypothetical protein n=1 Tax=Planococcus beijingensis TaxID=2782551 RepID=UPI00193AE0EA|nr:hypothetical protein [Planococcus beijingensis]
MTKRKKGYLELVFVLIIFVSVIFIFDFPKVVSFTTLGVLVIVNILIFEIFIFSKE